MPSVATIRELTIRARAEGTDQAAASLARVADAQSRVTQTAGGLAVATDTSTRRQLSAAPAFDRLRTSLDEAYRSQQAFARGQATLDRALAQGVTGLDTYNKTLDLLRAKHGQAGNDNLAPAVRAPKAGLDTYDRAFIRYQGFDAAMQLGAGANPLTVALQQGGQIAQQLGDREGGLTAGLKALGASAMAVVTPMTVAATVIAAVGAASLLAASQASQAEDAFRKSLTGAGRGTDATVSQLDAVARKGAEAATISLSSSRSIVAAYASTGDLTLPVLERLSEATDKFARLTGTDVATATQTLSRALADPSRGADQLQSVLGTLDDKTRQLIDTQVLQGNRSAAQATLTESLTSALAQATAQTSRWGQAWDFVAGAADKAYQAAGRAASVLAGGQSRGARLDELNSQIETGERTRNSLRGAGFNDEQIAQRSINVRGLDEARAERERLTQSVFADVNTRFREAEAERTSKLSNAAGNASRGFDPLTSTYRDLQSKQADLRNAINDPEARDRLADVDQARRALDGYTRAISTLTDANGRLITSEELSRRQDQLRIDGLNAKTTAEKAAVAERQKALDLIGKPVTLSDAAGQVSRAGQIARLSEAGKGGGSDRESRDDFDRVVRRTEDSIRRQQQEAETFGLGASAVARYRAETDLLVAAKRADRDITPTLLDQVRSYGDQASLAAQRIEDLRDGMRQLDGYRDAGREAFGGFFQSIRQGATVFDSLIQAANRFGDRIQTLFADQLFDQLFGKRGQSGGGLLGGGIGNLLGSLTGQGGGGWNFFSGGPSVAAADGGYIRGPGTTRSDSILARLSDREYVVQASAVAHYGVAFMDSINSRAARFRDGGPVGMPSYGGFSSVGMPPAHAMAPSAAPAAAGGVELHLHGAPAGSEQHVTETQGPRGARFDVQFEKMFDDHIASGKADAAIRKRFGMRGVGR